MGPMQRLVYIFEGKDELTPVARKISATLKKTGDDASKGFSSRLKNGLNTVGPMAASAIGVGLAFAVKKGMEVPMNALKVSLKEAGTNLDAFKPQLTSTEKRMEAMGFTNADVVKSMVQLLHATGNAKAAVEAQGTVADLAKVKHVGLADAALMLSRAADGNTRALKGLNVGMATGSTKAAAMEAAQTMLKERIQAAGGIAGFAAQNHIKLSEAQDLVKRATDGDVDALNQLGITALPKTATAADRLSQIQKVLNERIGGTAASAATTFGGKLAVMKARFTDIFAQLGLKLLPVLSSFMSIILKITSSTPLLITFATAIGLIAAAWIAVKVAALIASVGMRTALISSGIGAAILLVVLALTLIITHWKTIKKWAQIAISAVIAALKTAWNWIKKNWPLLLAILTGPFGLATKFIIDHWQTIKKGIGKVIGWLRGAWNSMIKLLRNKFADFVGFWLNMVGLILKGAAHMLSWVPGVGGKLKKASDAFETWKKNVNDSLRGVNDQTVNVGVKFKSGFAAGHGVSRGGVQTGLAKGGPLGTVGAVRGPGGPTSDKAGLFALSDNEYVVKASAHKKYGTHFLNQVNAERFAKGGPTGGDVAVKPKMPKMGMVNNMIGQDIWTMARQWWREHQGSGGAIVSFARKFLGQVPYVWGGDSTRGWDCSGFISYVYRHFNLMSGRNTAEGFRGWGRNVDSPLPGGMVFYGRPAYHIGMTAGGNRTLEAGGGQHTPTWGTTSGNTGFAIPPHGFGNHAGGAGTGGQWGFSELSNLWTSKGASGGRYAAAVALAESGGNAGIIQSGQPPGLTGYGLWQITPTSGIWQNGRFGNLLNASNNANAAVYLYRQAGSRFTPWSAFNSGAYQRFMSGGGPVSFDSGRGMLRPGMNLAYNGTGRNEYLSTGGATIIINAKALIGTKREVGQYVAEALQEHKQRGGRMP